MKASVFKKFILCILIISNAFFSFDVYSASPKITVVIDAGHGGIDTGAKIGGVSEKDITLDISKRLQKILTSKGFKVIMTRKSDVSPGANYKKGETRQLRDLNARVDTINKSGAKFFLSIHVNSLVKCPAENGSIVFYWGTSKRSKALAGSIQNELNKVTLSGKKRKAHDPRSEDFYILKKTKMQGVLIETAFLSNPSERKMLTKASFRQSIANSIAKGVEKYKKQL